MNLCHFASARVQRVVSFAGCLLLASLGTSAVQAAMVDLVAINRATTATAVAATGDPSPGSILSDQIWANQYDSGTGSTSAVALTFGSPQPFNKIFLYHTPGYVVQGFEVQVATVASPNVNNGSDWSTIPGGSFTSQASNGQSVFTFSQNFVSSGVRILATNKTNSPPNNIMRLKELMVFDRYQNVAPLANVAYSGPTLSNPASFLADELISNQAFFNQTQGAGTFDFTWNTPQTIGSFMVFGGSGAASEHLINFTIQADLGAGLQTLTTTSGTTAHTGNTAKVVHDILTGAISTTHVRLTVSSADADAFARISELFMFSPVPEPSSFVLTCVGMAGLWRIRGKRQERRGR